MRNRNVFTNTYGLARSILALNTLINLCFTSSYVYFQESHFDNLVDKPFINYNLFYAIGIDNIWMANILSILILFWVISGYLPQITGILHAWVAWSFFQASMIIEGGDQIVQILTILLIPITIFDKRINHWFKKDFFKYGRSELMSYFCYSILVIAKIQIAILYFFASAEKFKVTEWRDGSAFYYWFNHNMFGATGLMHYVFSKLVNNPFISPFISWAVLILEALIFASIFIDRKYKKYFFLLATAFHVMIYFIHGLASFFFAIFGALIIYYLPWEGIELKKIKVIK